MWVGLSVWVAVVWGAIADRAIADRMIADRWAAGTALTLRRIGRAGLHRTPSPAWPIGLPAVVPRGDAAVVGNAHEDPVQERERVGGLGPAVDPSELPHRSVTVSAVWSYVSRSSATGFHA
jgi:hypothetical protein